MGKRIKSTKRSKLPVLYEDMAAIQDRKAAAADLKAIVLLEKRIRGKQTVVNESIVDIINAMVKQGEALQRVVKREQMSFSFFQSIQGSLPWGRDAQEAFGIAKRRIGIASALSGGIKDISDLQPDLRRQIYVQLGLLMAGERGENGPSVKLTDPFSKFLNNMLSIKQELQKCERICPLEQMSRPQLENFMVDTQWIADERERADKILNPPLQEAGRNGQKS